MITDYLSLRKAIKGQYLCHLYPENVLSRSTPSTSHRLLTTMFHYEEPDAILFFDAVRQIFSAFSSHCAPLSINGNRATIGCFSRPNVSDGNYSPTTASLCITLFPILESKQILNEMIGLLSAIVCLISNLKQYTVTQEQNVTFIIFRPYFIWERKIFKSNGFFFIFRPYFIWERKIFKSNGFFFFYKICQDFIYI